MDTLFATYVLDVIGHLTPEKERSVMSMAPKLRQALGTTATEWRAVVAEALHLSATIDIAILDLWHTNGDAAKAAGTTLTPDAFAGMFVEEYSKDGSRVDVWPGDALDRAKARIARRS
ncbi:hypothetical protein [Anaeromyxobacter oryzae]|uniref:hypothetical protein n=1 Tax=Anaeromyxobacter oryzae TaxID=2918170 RepID=UPI0020BDB054|nr:hypothetical protein [Anaeromyxobacter oryzae]